MTVINTNEVTKPEYFFIQSVVLTDYQNPNG
jgi:hypothetical protein